VLVSPSYNETSVNELADRARSLWLAAVPFAIAATIAAAYCISRVIQNGVRPLDNAIAARLRSGDVRTDSDKIPNELRPTFGHFVEIMDELENASLGVSCPLLRVVRERPVAWRGGQYLFYGMYYFVLILLGLVVEPMASGLAKRAGINRCSAPYRAMRICRTLLIVFVGELFFRATSLDAGFAMFGG
jgi:hypothetical protein